MNAILSDAQRLRITAASLPLGLQGPGGVTDFLERADLPDHEGERIGAVMKIRPKSGKGNSPYLFDVGREWGITRANAKTGGN